MEEDGDAMRSSAPVREMQTLVAQMAERDLYDALRPHLRREKILTDPTGTIPIRPDMLRALARKWRMHREDPGFWRRHPDPVSLALALAEHGAKLVEGATRRRMRGSGDGGMTLPDLKEGTGKMTKAERTAAALRALRRALPPYDGDLFGQRGDYAESILYLSRVPAPSPKRKAPGPLFSPEPPSSRPPLRSQPGSGRRRSLLPAGVDDAAEAVAAGRAAEEQSKLNEFLSSLRQADESGGSGGISEEEAERKEEDEQERKVVMQEKLEKQKKEGEAMASDIERQYLSAYAQSRGADESTVAHIREATEVGTSEQKALAEKAAAEAAATGASDGRDLVFSRGRPATRATTASSQASEVVADLVQHLSRGENRGDGEFGGENGGDGGGATLREQVARAMRDLCRDPAARLHILGEGAVPALVRGFSRPDSVRLRMDCAVALANLSAVPVSDPRHSWLHPRPPAPPTRTLGDALLSAPSSDEEGGSKGRRDPPVPPLTPGLVGSIAETARATAARGLPPAVRCLVMTVLANTSAERQHRPRAVAEGLVPAVLSLLIPARRRRAGAPRPNLRRCLETLHDAETGATTKKQQPNLDIVREDDEEEEELFSGGGASPPTSHKKEELFSGGGASPPTSPKKQSSSSSSSSKKQSLDIIRAAQDAYVLALGVRALCNASGCVEGAESLLQGTALSDLARLWDWFTREQRCAIAAHVVYNTTRRASSTRRVAESGGVRILSAVLDDVLRKSRTEGELLPWEDFTLRRCVLALSRVARWGGAAAAAAMLDAGGAKALAAAVLGPDLDTPLDAVAGIAPNETELEEAMAAAAFDMSKGSGVLPDPASGAADLYRGTTLRRRVAAAICRLSWREEAAAGEDGVAAAAARLAAADDPATAALACVALVNLTRHATPAIALVRDGGLSILCALAHRAACNVLGREEPDLGNPWPLKGAFDPEITRVLSGKRGTDDPSADIDDPASTSSASAQRRNNNSSKFDSDEDSVGSVGEDDDALLTSSATPSKSKPASTTPRLAALSPLLGMALFNLTVHSEARDSLVSVATSDARSQFRSLLQGNIRKQEHDHTHTLLDDAAGFDDHLSDDARSQDASEDGSYHRDGILALNALLALATAATRVLHSHPHGDAREDAAETLTFCTAALRSVAADHSEAVAIAPDAPQLLLSLLTGDIPTSTTTTTSSTTKPTTSAKSTRDQLPPRTPAKARAPITSTSSSQTPVKFPFPLQCVADAVQTVAAVSRSPRARAILRRHGVLGALIPIASDAPTSALQRAVETAEREARAQYRARVARVEAAEAASRRIARLLSDLDPTRPDSDEEVEDEQTNEAEARARAKREREQKEAERKRRLQQQQQQQQQLARKASRGALRPPANGGPLTSPHRGRIVGPPASAIAKRRAEVAAREANALKATLPSVGSSSTTTIHPPPSPSASNSTNKPKINTDLSSAKPDDPSKRPMVKRGSSRSVLSGSTGPGVQSPAAQAAARRKEEADKAQRIDQATATWIEALRGVATRARSEAAIAIARVTCDNAVEEAGEEEDGEHGRVGGGGGHSAQLARVDPATAIEAARVAADVLGSDGGGTAPSKEALEALVTLCTFGKDGNPIRERVAASLHLLSASDAVARVLLDSGERAIAAIVGMCSSGREGVRKEAIGILSRLAAVQGGEVLLVRGGAVRALLSAALLRTEEAETRARAATALHNLLCHPPARREALHHGAVWALQRLALARDAATQRVCAVTLRQLATDRVGRAALVREGALRAVVEVLFAAHGRRAADAVDAGAEAAADLLALDLGRAPPSRSSSPRHGRATSSRRSSPTRSPRSSPDRRSPKFRKDLDTEQDTSKSSTAETPVSILEVLDDARRHGRSVNHTKGHHDRNTTGEIDGAAFLEKDPADVGHRPSYHSARASAVSGSRAGSRAGSDVEDVEEKEDALMPDPAVGEYFAGVLAAVSRESGHEEALVASGAVEALVLLCEDALDVGSTSKKSPKSGDESAASKRDSSATAMLENCTLGILNLSRASGEAGATVRARVAAGEAPRVLTRLATSKDAPLRPRRLAVRTLARLFWGGATATARKVVGEGLPSALVALAKVGDDRDRFACIATLHAASARTDCFEDVLADEDVIPMLVRAVIRGSSKVGGGSEAAGLSPTQGRSSRLDSDDWDWSGGVEHASEGLLRTATGTLAAQALANFAVHPMGQRALLGLSQLPSGAPSPTSSNSPQRRSPPVPQPRDRVPSSNTDTEDEYADDFEGGDVTEDVQNVDAEDGAMALTPLHALVEATLKNIHLLQGYTGVSDVSAQVAALARAAQDDIVEQVAAELEPVARDVRDGRSSATSPQNTSTGLPFSGVGASTSGSKTEQQRKWSTPAKVLFPMGLDARMLGGGSHVSAARRKATEDTSALPELTRRAQKAAAGIRRGLGGDTRVAAQLASTGPSEDEYRDVLVDGAVAAMAMLCAAATRGETGPPDVVTSGPSTILASECPRALAAVAAAQVTGSPKAVGALRVFCALGGSVRKAIVSTDEAVVIRDLARTTATITEKLGGSAMHMGDDGLWGMAFQDPKARGPPPGVRANKLRTMSFLQVDDAAGDGGSAASTPGVDDDAAEMGEVDMDSAAPYVLAGRLAVAAEFARREAVDRATAVDLGMCLAAFAADDSARPALVLAGAAGALLSVATLTDLESNGLVVRQVCLRALCQLAIDSDSAVYTSGGQPVTADTLAANAEERAEVRTHVVNLVRKRTAHLLELPKDTGMERVANRLGELPDVGFMRKRFGSRKDVFELARDGTGSDPDVTSTVPTSTAPHSPRGGAPPSATTPGSSASSPRRAGSDRSTGASSAAAASPAGSAAPPSAPESASRLLAAGAVPAMIAVMNTRPGEDASTNAEAAAAKALGATATGDTVGRTMVGEDVPLPEVWPLCMDPRWRLGSRVHPGLLRLRHPVGIATFGGYFDADDELKRLSLVSFKDEPPTHLVSNSDRDWGERSTVIKSFAANANKDDDLAMNMELGKIAKMARQAVPEIQSLRRRPIAALCEIITASERFGFFVKHSDLAQNDFPAYIWRSIGEDEEAQESESIEDSAVLSLRATGTPVFSGRSPTKPFSAASSSTLSKQSAPTSKKPTKKSKMYTWEKIPVADEESIVLEPLILKNMDKEYGVTAGLHLDLSAFESERGLNEEGWGSGDDRLAQSIGSRGGETSSPGSSPKSSTSDAPAKVGSAPKMVLRPQRSMKLPPGALLDDGLLVLRQNKPMTEESDPVSDDKVATKWEVAFPESVAPEVTLDLDLIIQGLRKLGRPKRVRDATMTDAEARLHRLLGAARARLEKEEGDDVYIEADDVDDEDVDDSGSARSEVSDVSTGSYAIRPTQNTPKISKEDMRLMAMHSLLTRGMIPSIAIVLHHSSLRKEGRLLIDPTPGLRLQKKREVFEDVSLLEKARVEQAASAEAALANTPPPQNHPERPTPLHNVDEHDESAAERGRLLDGAVDVVGEYSGGSDFEDEDQHDQPPKKSSAPAPPTTSQLDASKSRRKKKTKTASSSTTTTPFYAAPTKASEQHQKTVKKRKKKTTKKKKKE